MTQLAAAIGSTSTVREQYFGYTSSGAPKGAASALAGWRAYWCGLTAMSGSTFTTCQCTTPK
jgi:hypothetical protein